MFASVLCQRLQIPSDNKSQSIETDSKKAMSTDNNDINTWHFLADTSGFSLA